MTSFDAAMRATLDELPRQKRLLGIDLGTKTIGLATSDLTRQIATPRQTIVRTKFQSDATQLLTFRDAENIGLLIIGLPLNMDGSEGPRCQSTRAFIRNLQRLSALPVIFWDERLSTAAVNRVMLDADLSRAKRADNVDKLAAAYILQSFLDASR